LYKIRIINRSYEDPPEEAAAKIEENAAAPESYLNDVNI